MTYNFPAEYFDATDISKNYSRLLFIAGRGLSSAELNSIQSMIKSDLAALGRYLVRNGSVLTGGIVTSLTSSAITISAASVLVDGHAIQVPSASVAITAVGLEIIGVGVLKSLVTDSQDPSIREPDPLSPNFGNALSYREQTSGTWCLSTDTSGFDAFFPIITLNNGQIVSISHSGGDDNTNFESILNKYDNETNGSYLLYGLQGSFSKFDVSNSPIINVTSGKARVLGIPVQTPYATTVPLDPISDVSQALGEPYVFTANGNIPLRYNPISQVVSLQGVQQANNVTITHGGYAGVADQLPNTPVLQILSVTQTNGSNTTTYVQGQDFKQTNDQVDWSLTTMNKKEPSPGSTYQVTYTYISTFVPAVTSDGLSIVLDSSHQLVANTSFYVTYYYYLKRVDRVSLNQYGLYLVNRGTPSYLTYQAPPYLASALSLFTVTLVKGKAPVISSDTTVNVNRATLNQLLNTVANLQISVAGLELKQDANALNPTLTTKQIFVDPLRDYSQTDQGLTNNVTIDNGIMSLMSNVTALASSTTPYTLPFTEVSVISNPWYTEKTRINPYAGVNAPLLGTSGFSPSSYLYTGLITGTVARAGQVGVVPYSTQGNGYSAWYYGRLNIEYIYANQARLGLHNPLVRTISTTGTDTPIPTAQTTTLSLTKFYPNDTITITFLNTVTTAKADSNGTVSVTLTVPAGTGSGNYLATAVGSTGTQASSIYSVNSKTYVANYNFIDPLAETIVPPEVFDITSFSVYVVDLPADDIVVKIVGLVGGNPDPTTVYTTGRLAKASVVVGWNKVPMRMPWTLIPDGSYAAIVTTTQFQGTIGTSTVGKVDLITQKLLTTNPVNGVMLSSANEVTWTASQAQDLTHSVNKAVYNTATTTYSLAAMTNVAAVTDWNLSIDAIVPSGTTLRFYLQDSANNQYDILPYQWCFTPALSGNVTLYATLTSNSSKASPLILPGMVLYGGTATVPGTYFSRQISIPNGTNVPANLTLVVDLFVNGTSSVLPQIQLANGTYANMTQTSSTPIGNGVFTAYYTYSNLASNNTRLSFILNNTNPTDRPLVMNPRLVFN